MESNTRSTIIQVLISVFFVGITACSADKRHAEPHSEAELAGLTVAVGNGNYHHEKLSKRDDVNLYVTTSEADAVQALRQELVDVFVTDEVMLTKADQERLGIKKAFSSGETFDAAFGIQKGNELLRRQFSEFSANTPIDAIIAHWIDGGPEITEPAYKIDDNAQPLRCITCTNLAPISFISEGAEWQGMDPDILRRFAHYIGRPFEVEYLDLGAAIVALQTGNADMISACLFITEERKKVIDFTIPYYKCRAGYFVIDHSKESKIGLGERLKNNIIIDNRWQLILDGLWETIKITLLSILLGTILGGGVCAMRRSRKRWLRQTAAVYGQFISDIPTLVLLLIMFYVVFAGTGISSTAVAIITFALCFAASAGSIFDAAISSVPRGQMEAGLSLGLTPAQTFNGIIFPQALRQGLAPFTGACVSLLKGTSIVGYIAIYDLTHVSNLIRTRTFDALVPFLIITVLYFLLAWIIRWLLGLLLKIK